MPDPSLGPYRSPATEDDSPPRRSGSAFVTWAGALVLLAAIGIVVEAATRELRSGHELDGATEELADVLGDPRVARIARTYDPRELYIPTWPPLADGESPEERYVVRIDHDDGPPIAADARGIAIRARRPRLDAAQLALGARGATSSDDARWVAVVRRSIHRDRYHYDIVSVDVEIAYVAIVDLASEALVLRMSVEAAPPASQPRARETYRLAPELLAAAITDALTD